MALSSARGRTQVIWVVVHTAEGVRKASDLKAFFDRATDRSAHAVADDTTLIDNCVPYDRAAWTLRNGNTRSDNLELCGFAGWSRDEWINEHGGMLSNAAAWIRSRCTARDIPIVKIGPAEVARGAAGVIGHVDYTLGTHDGTHTDPGPGFPWDVVIQLAAQEDDMAGQLADDEIAFAQKRLTDSGRPKRVADFCWVDPAIYIGQIKVQIDALAGSLAAHEANIIAATRQIVADDADATVELTPEQVDQFAMTVLEPLPAHIRESVREAFARAGQP